MRFSIKIPTLYLEYQISSSILEEEREGGWEMRIPPKYREMERWRVGYNKFNFFGLTVSKAFIIDSEDFNVVYAVNLNEV